MYLVPMLAVPFDVLTTNVTYLSNFFTKCANKYKGNSVSFVSFFTLDKKLAKVFKYLKAILKNSFERVVNVFGSRQLRKVTQIVKVFVANPG